MADQITIPELDVAIDPTNGLIYIIIGGVDYQISYDDLVKYCLKNINERVGTASLIAGSQDVIFQVNGVDTPMDTANYVIIPYSKTGIAFEITAWDENGFTIDSLEAQDIDYIVKLNT
jgi:hypothetical protein